MRATGATVAFVVLTLFAVFCASEATVRDGEVASLGDVDEAGLAALISTIDPKNNGDLKHKCQEIETMCRGVELRERNEVLLATLNGKKCAEQDAKIKDLNERIRELEIELKTQGQGKAEAAEKKADSEADEAKSAESKVETEEEADEEAKLKTKGVFTASFNKAEKKIDSEEKTASTEEKAEAESEKAESAEEKVETEEKSAEKIEEKPKGTGVFTASFVQAEKKIVNTVEIVQAIKDGAKSPKPADSKCSDSAWYSNPYEKIIYQLDANKRTAYKEIKELSKCVYESNKKPCEDRYFKGICGKLCGTGTNTPHMDQEYVLNEREVSESVEYGSRCEYEEKRGSCKSTHIQARCKKTCNLCKDGDDKCVDDKYMNRPFVDRKYKKQKYSSRCEYHNASGQCTYDKNRIKYEPSRERSYKAYLKRRLDQAKKDPKAAEHLKKYPPRPYIPFKSRCEKTCTGNGEDAKGWDQPTEGYAFKVHKFESRCAFEFKMRSNPCKGLFLGRHNLGHFKQRCAKTCTGKGEDDPSMAKPFTRREPIVKEVKKYSSRCQYVKESKLCTTDQGAGCVKTCDTCGICRDYGAYCKSYKERGMCDSPRYAHAVLRCRKSCGMCDTEGADKKETVDAKDASLATVKEVTSKEVATTSESEKEAEKEVVESEDADDKDEGVAAEPTAMKPGESKCSDSAWYSNPYEKISYELDANKRTKFKEVTVLSRCDEISNKKPCDDIYFKGNCAKLCGIGKTNAPHMAKEYLYREREVEESVSYASRCEYEETRGGCKSKYTQQRCKKTCKLCKDGDDTCADDSYMSTPYVQRTYKRQKYSSKCEYHEKTGRCQWDQDRVAQEPLSKKRYEDYLKRGQERAKNDPKAAEHLKKYPPRPYRPFVPPCQKTCTGKGEDAKGWDQPTEGYAYKVHKFESRCAFDFKMRSNPCKGLFTYQRFPQDCAKTCTGKGANVGHMSRPYTKREPIVKSVKKYSSRCQYVKEAKLCDTHEGAGCSKTCDTCGICRDYAPYCKSYKDRGMCNSPRYAHAVQRCPASCGMCDSERADKAPFHGGGSFKVKAKTVEAMKKEEAEEEKEHEAEEEEKEKEKEEEKEEEPEEEEKEEEPEEEKEEEKKEAEKEEEPEEEKDEEKKEAEKEEASSSFTRGGRRAVGGGSMRGGNGEEYDTKYERYGLADEDQYEYEHSNLDLDSELDLE